MVQILKHDLVSSPIKRTLFWGITREYKLPCTFVVLLDMFFYTLHFNFLTPLLYLSWILATVSTDVACIVSIVIYTMIIASTESIGGAWKSAWMTTASRFSTFWCWLASTGDRLKYWIWCNLCTTLDRNGQVVFYSPSKHMESLVASVGGAIWLAALYRRTWSHAHFTCSTAHSVVDWRLCIFGGSW